MKLYDVICKLVGPIDPIGDSGEDEDRLKNLKTLTTTVDQILSDIHRVKIYNENRVEWSRKTAGIHASKFLQDVHDTHEGGFHAT